MPRARNIKPAFFENEFLGTLPGDIQILFIGLWTEADREGILEYRPAKLRKALFGFRPDITDEIFNGYITVLEQLDCGSMLKKTVCNGKQYIIITNFLDHQTPHKTEKKKKCPTLKVLLEAERLALTVKQPLDNEKNPSQNALNPDLLNPDLLIPDCGILKDENVQENLERDFDIFWLQYPKNNRSKGSVREAKAKFKIALKKDTLKNIIQGVKNYEIYIRNTGQSNKDAFRWLEKEQWRDDYTIVSGIGTSNNDKHQRTLEAAARGHARAQNPDF